MKTLIAFMLFSVNAFAQSITIPSQTITTPVTFNGTSGKITITIPAQTVALPTQSSGLPTGLTYTNGVFAVSGSVQATSISLTGGPVLPVCASGLYFLAPASSGSTTLQPSCYIVPTFTMPAITVSQAATPINTFTFTP